MKLLLKTIAFVILTTGLSLSQLIELQVISSCGNSGNLLLNWTTGEAVTGGNSLLTQGFHQGKLIITAVDDLENNYEFIAYPNPSQRGFFIKSEIIDNLNILVYDLNGKILIKKTESQLPVFIDISSYQNGIYFVRIEKDKQLLKTFKIEKIN